MLCFGRGCIEKSKGRECHPFIDQRTKAAETIQKPIIFVVGNAPTALLELDKLIKNGEVKPAFVIGVPVGFVHVCESKEIIMKSGVPYIVAKGRKGGSNVAAAIVNALLYMACPRE